MSTLNIEPRTIFNKDNIEILKNINSNCIDLIYLNPPFNKNKKFVAPTGSSAEGVKFSDIFREEDIKEKYKQLCLFLQFGGIREMNIHRRCAKLLALT